MRPPSAVRHPPAAMRRRWSAVRGPPSVVRRRTKSSELPLPRRPLGDTGIPCTTRSPGNPRLPLRVVSRGFSNDRCGQIGRANVHPGDGSAQAPTGRPAPGRLHRCTDPIGDSIASRPPNLLRFGRCPEPGCRYGIPCSGYRPRAGPALHRTGPAPGIVRSARPRPTSESRRRSNRGIQGRCPRHVLPPHRRQRCPGPAPEFVPVIRQRSRH